jgi:hypothetical protein
MILIILMDEEWKREREREPGNWTEIDSLELEIESADRKIYFPMIVILRRNSPKYPVKMAGGITTRLPKNIYSSLGDGL